MNKHFVTFYSPGTLFSEQTTREIESWDVEKAKAIATEIKERYNATPYGFKFSTRSRTEADLDSRQTDASPMYYLGGKVETLAEVEARATEKDRILLANMRGNGYNRIITNTNSWRATLPLEDDDVVLDWPPR